jgi:hypothetical protein
MQRNAGMRSMRETMSQKRPRQRGDHLDCTCDFQTVEYVKRIDSGFSDLFVCFCGKEVSLPRFITQPSLSSHQPLSATPFRESSHQ